MTRSLTLALMTLGIAVGCSSGPPDQLGAGGAGSTATSGNSSPASTSTSGAGAGPASSSSSGGPSATTLGPSVDKDETLTGDIDMPATTTIAPGVTLTLGAGATIHAGAGALLLVKGTLVANGTAGSEVAFQSKAHAGAGDWTGIEVASGGDAKLTHAAIHDASLAFQADAGSMFTIDYILIDTSSTIAELDADGTIGHGVLHGNGAKQQGDPIYVTSASPKFTDTLVDNSNAGTDQINVSGKTSSPTFDHMEITNCHCAFHFNEGGHMSISNSYVHDTQYGLMVEHSLENEVDSNNFMANAVANIGECMVDGSVTAKGNYFQSNKPFDGSCSVQVHQNDAAMPLQNVGPRP